MAITMNELKKNMKNLEVGSSRVLRRRIEALIFSPVNHILKIQRQL